MLAAEMAQSLTTLFLEKGRPTALQLQGAELAVVEGADTGKTTVIEGRTVRIGTEPSNDLVLSDRAVSRFHCRIEVSDDAFVLRDIGSSNGTVVESVRVREALLEDGQRVRLGNTTLLFRWTKARIEIDLSAEEGFGEAIGASVPMRELFGLLARVAPTDAPVLLLGETGTGKEVLAEAIHERSARAGGPFEIFDCSGTPPTLIESELFGHERGAFTGAVDQRVGLFERAEGGTVFLDEIGELPLDLQPKLLRALESGEVRRLGGKRMTKLDVRIIAATNRDIDAMLAQGTFRADLYHRLAVMVARIPPLRLRRDDIPLLAAHFLHTLRYLQGIPAPVVRNYIATSLGVLQTYAWPGNVRELRNVVERAAILADPATIEADALTRLNAVRKTLSIGGGLGRLPMRLAVEQFEREYLTDLLRTCGRSIPRAGEVAELHPKSIERLLRKYGLRAKDL
jgi:DNA-binding NtrC family response regulator